MQTTGTTEEAGDVSRSPLSTGVDPDLVLEGRRMKGTSGDELDDPLGIDLLVLIIALNGTILGEVLIALLYNKTSCLQLCYLR